MPTNAKKPSAKRAKADPELAAVYERVGRRLRHLRELAGQSQREVSVAVFGTPEMQGNVSRWEAGRTLPNIATLHQIARHFGTSLGDLGLYEPQDVPSGAAVASARDHLTRALELLNGKG